MFVVLMRSITLVSLEILHDTQDFHTSE